MPTLIDLTLRVNPADHLGSERYRFLDAGHLGTHFDVMNKDFPPHNLERPAVVFDVKAARDRNIQIGDIDLAMVDAGMFVAFYTGYGEAYAYGTPEYFEGHPVLCRALIDTLLDKGVSIIGIDCAGIRRGKEHTPADQLCADRGAFVVENLCNLDRVLAGKPSARFTAHTYPVNFAGMTGLPCRVAAEV